jgi:hypothetical protein
MRIISWNLAKLDLVDWSLSKGVEVALFQEYNALFAQRVEGYFKFEAISFDDTFGTSVFSREKPIAVHEVKSPHWDYRAQIWKGPIYKNTAVATFENGLTVVSFHGFNGTMRGRDPEMLVDHIEAVLKVIPSGSCIFAGDFNTFTREHQEAVGLVMDKHAFTRAIQVPYDDKKTLDMVYTRNCTAQLVESGHYKSDHPFMLFDVEL